MLGALTQTEVHGTQIWSMLTQMLGALYWGSWYSNYKVHLLKCWVYFTQTEVHDTQMWSTLTQTLGALYSWSCPRSHPQSCPRYSNVNCIHPICGAHTQMWGAHYSIWCELFSIWGALNHMWGDLLWCNAHTQLFDQSEVWLCVELILKFLVKWTSSYSVWGSIPSVCKGHSVHMQT